MGIARQRTHPPPPHAALGGTGPSRGSEAERRIAEGGSGVVDKASEARRNMSKYDIDSLETKYLERDQLDRNKRLHLRWTETMRWYMVRGGYGFPH